MKHLILAAATLLFIHGADAREHRGPPPICPEPKAECCPKPKPKAKPCQPGPCKPKCAPAPKPCPPPCPPVWLERGFETDPCCTPSAYSEHAAFEVKCGWDTFFTVSFIYWEAIQGGMDLAIPEQGTISGSTLTDPAPSALGFQPLKTDFEYKPGFQVGLGWSGPKDNWVLYAEYTWLHGTTSTSRNAPNPNVATVDGIDLPQSGIWLPSSWMPIATNSRTTHISSQWNYKIDILDGQISRPFYSGARFVLEPFFGLRGAWIRQHLSMQAANLATTVAIPGATRVAHYASTSRAVGPRAGLNGSWFLGYGLRFIGDVAASLLYTGYDISQNVASPDASGTTEFPVKMKMDDVNGLRPNLDLSIGLGWGSYFGCRSYHWDVSASYDFNIYWEQNMMRYLADTVYAGTGASPSDLYLQGLTLKTQFDF